MDIAGHLKVLTARALKELYDYNANPGDLTVTITKPEFVGDYTLVLFSFVKQLKKSPEQLGKELGQHLLASHPSLFTAHNVIKGFLNLSIADDYWTHFLQSYYNEPAF